MNISKSPIITPLLPQSQSPIRTQNPQYQIYNPNNYPYLEQPQKPLQKNTLKTNKNSHSLKARHANQPLVPNKQKPQLCPNLNQQSYTYTIAELPSLQHTQTHSHVPRTSVSNSPSPHHSTLYRSKSPSYLHICHPSHLSNTHMNPVTKSQIKAFSNQIERQQDKKQKEMQRRIQEFQQIQEEIYNMKENTIYKSKEPLMDMTKQEVYFGLYAAKGKWNKMKEPRIQGKGGKEYEINVKEVYGGNQIQNERDTGRFNNIRNSKKSVQQYEQQILSMQKQYNRLRCYLSQLQQQIRVLKQQNSKLSHKLSIYQSKSNNNYNNNNNKKQLKSPLPLPSSTANQSQTDLSLQKILSNINTNIYDDRKPKVVDNGKEGNLQRSSGGRDTKHYFQGRIDQDIVRSLTLIGDGNASLYSDNIQLLKLAKQEIIQRDTKINQLESKLSYISQTITSPHSSPSPFPDLQSQLLTLSSSLQRSFSQQLLLKQKIKILEQKLKNIIQEVKEIQSRSLRQEKEILEKEIQMEMEVRYIRGLVALDREKDGNADWGEISDHGDKDEKIIQRKKSNTYAYPLAPSECRNPKKIWYNKQDSNSNLNQFNCSTPQHNCPFSPYPYPYSYANTNVKKSSTEVTQYSGYNGYTFRKLEGENSKQRQRQK